MNIRELGENLAEMIRREHALVTELREVQRGRDELIKTIRDAPGETVYENTNDQTLVRPYMDDAAFVDRTEKLTMSGNSTVGVGLSAIVLCPGAGLSGHARDQYCREHRRHAHTADGKVHVLS